MSQDGTPKDGTAPAQAGAQAGEDDGFVSRRQAVRMSTVYGGRICQHGRAYPCVISDVSEGGAKVKLKDPYDFGRITKTGEMQLVFERLSEYNALNGDVAWLNPGEHVVGVRFTDADLRRRVVLKRLMPNRWRVAKERSGAPENGED